MYTDIYKFICICVYFCIYIYILGSFKVAVLSSFSLIYYKNVLHLRPFFIFVKCILSLIIDIDSDKGFLFA